MTSKWLWLSLIIVISDQATKVFASSTLAVYQSIEFLPYFNFTLLHNYGAAFGLFDDGSGWQRWFFTVIAILVSIGMLYWIKRLKPEERRMAFSLSLVLGGAIGNVIDRILHGYVVDFIDIYYKADSCMIGFGPSKPGECHWPAFNIADMAITTAVIILIADMLFSSLREYKLKKQGEIHG